MRIALASILLISVLGVSAPAAAATDSSPTRAGSIVMGFNICAMFPGLPWCPK